MTKKKKTTRHAAKKGGALVCVPCGRRVTVSSWGTSASTLYCCGKPMKKK